MHTNTNQKICQPTSEDWHQADIVASLKKAGTNLSALSEQHGFSRSCLRNALYRRYPKAERIIAQAIGVTPEEIWPSRYA
ncbi:helix-turn-helix domain-containing protein [Moraxella bovis]|uniref:DNA-binding transcriptional regulator Nlp n=1 Tax=Moraxella bovis TaxID=476 RepID=A0A378PU80_MORBO|nr:helix-turn-helix transcriptional regulator [Moraxella bovis]STY90302.1 DNA-binding transcriptional regulator Nlp [Moraxella bovis]